MNKHSETEKRELYTNIVKLMASDGKFKENFMQIEDFDDKILLLEIYKEYNEQKSIRNGGNKR